MHNKHLFIHVSQSKAPKNYWHLSFLCYFHCPFPPTTDHLHLHTLVLSTIKKKDNTPPFMRYLVPPTKNIGRPRGCPLPFTLRGHSKRSRHGTVYKEVQLHHKLSQHFVLNSRGHEPTRKFCSRNFLCAWVSRLVARPEWMLLRWRQPHHRQFIRTSSFFIIEKLVQNEFHQLLFNNYFTITQINKV